MSSIVTVEEVYSSSVENGKYCSTTVIERRNTIIVIAVTFLKVHWVYIATAVVGRVGEKHIVRFFILIFYRF